MASPNSSSPSSKARWEYDVFINFRGTLRKNFISHLADAMERAEIKYFIDEKAPRRGRKLRDELMQAIERSQIAVVVFSKDYTNSHWCLNELVKIMECKKTVLPVFYDKAGFGSHLEVTAAKKYPDKKEQKQILSRWKDALNQAAELSRYCLISDCKNEAELVKKIVANILTNTKANTSRPSSNTDSPVRVHAQKVLGFAQTDYTGINGLPEQFVVYMAMQNNMGDLAEILGNLSKLRSHLLQFQLPKLSTTFPDDLYDFRSYSIGTGSYQEVFNTLINVKETITEGDNLLTRARTSEGRSVFFVVPRDNDYCRLKGMALGVYSSSPENMVAEFLTCVCIVNYTKCTIQIYQRDTVISFNNWQGLISSLGPGDQVEIFPTFRHKMAIKKTAVFLTYDVTNNKLMPAPLKLSTTPSKENLNGCNCHRYQHQKAFTDSFYAKIVKKCLPTLVVGALSTAAIFLLSCTEMRVKGVAKGRASQMRTLDKMDSIGKVALC